ncbi:TonB-dependent siderophore receptor [Methylomonas fluvii]|uniref:TonB-dependent receptor n=1 Tax=Methylomonas fluvii TaxID=1854564 RepID=A0ABR9DGI4_9GAMM|nr:TonB-dependent receptor [Methylomonas fluvii]MBD9362195.1 TonB-dependent receptor [Methylomonas fluvii]
MRITGNPRGTRKNRTKGSSAIGALPLCLGLITAATLPTVQAESPSANGESRNYNIAAQPLYSALSALAEQSGVQFVYNSELVKGIDSPGVIGNYSLEGALKRLLQGSQVSYQFNNGNTVTLHKSAALEPQSNAATLPSITVTGLEIYADTDPYNPSYTRRVTETATKTDTPLMETPVNIQVIPKAVLDDQQTIQMTEALKNVAGATVSHGSGGLSDDIFLRGFRSSTYFRNGFRIDSQYASIGNRQMANVERLEVIKGPAAIMYGRMEPGGMVNVVTKTPLATPYYALQQQFGSYDLYRTTLDATGPLTQDDTLLYRFNGSFESSGSFREFVNSERTFLAPIVTWNISPRTQVSLEMEYRHDNLMDDPNNWPFVDGRFIDMPRSRNFSGAAGKVNVEEKLIGLNWSHQFNDNWAIKQRFVADLLDTAQNWPGISVDTPDPDNMVSRSVTFVPTQNNTYYTTLDVTGHFGTGPLEHTLLMGGDYYRTDNISDPYTAELAPINIYNPVHNSSPITPFSPAGWASSNSADFVGLYAQDQIKLPYGLNVMGGFRYQYVKQWDNLNHTEQPADDEVTPRVGVLWQAQDWLSLYGNYIENFGVSNQWATTLTGKPLPPESGQQWEVGSKFEFFDGKLSATLAYYDITKQNVVTRDPSDVTGNFSIAAGEVRSKGPEVDIRGELLPGWNLIATYANFDTRVSKDNNGLEGNRLFAVPRNVGSLWSTYDFRQGDLRGLKVGGGISMRDGATDGSRNGYQTAGYATVDLLAAYAWKVEKSKITVQLNVNNLLDKTYFPDAYWSSASSTRTIGTPRSLLGSIKVEF